MTTVPALHPQAAQLVARTVPIPDPGPLLDLLPQGRAVSWVRRGEGLVGWGEVARVTTSGARRFVDAERAWHGLVRHAAVRDEVGLPGTGPIAFGSFAFADSSPAGGVLVVPEIVVGRRGSRAWITVLGRGPVLPVAESRRPVAPPTSPGTVTFTEGTRSADFWRNAVATAIERIDAGRLGKVVLARDLVARAGAPIDVRWLLRRLAENYPGCWTFVVDGLVGATPELLVRREKGLVTSRVLAGTIQRSGNDERDLALAASLARSSKDLEEHEFAVRSVAEALTPHCSSTNVPESPFVLHLANVMHLATDVTGVLADGTSSLSLAQALHPSAAVCGTPRQAASMLIEEIEGMDRDRYAGPVGWTDAEGDGEWGIALRSARLDAEDPCRLRLFAGCGIVGGSDPLTELAEAEAKFIPIRTALGTDR